MIIYEIPSIMLTDFVDSSLKSLQSQKLCYQPHFTNEKNQEAGKQNAVLNLVGSDSEACGLKDYAILQNLTSQLAAEVMSKVQVWEW